MDRFCSHHCWLVHLDTAANDSNSAAKATAATLQVNAYVMHASCTVCLDCVLLRLTASAMHPLQPPVHVAYLLHLTTCY
jgi:hypothetical protein